MAIYKEKNNKTWRFQIRDTTRRGFATKKQARIAEELFLASDVRPVLTFDELANEYLLMLKIQKERSSYLTALGHYKNNLKMKIGNKKVDAIKPMEILNIQNDMIKRGCAPGYTNTITTLLKTIFNYAIKMDYIDKTPCKSVSKLKMTKNQEKIIFWTPQQFNEVIQHEENFTYYCLFNILYFTGMRVSEAKALWWNDIDLENKVITITHHMIYKGFISREKGRKNSGEHTILIPLKLLTILKELKEFDMQFDGYTNESYVLGVIRPLPLNTSQRHLDKCSKKANVPRLNIHGLRHSHASFLINNKATPFEVAHRLGDTVDVVMQRYAHLFNETETRVVDIIDKYFDEDKQETEKILNE